MYEGPLRIKYWMSICQCYVAQMNAMCNISTREKNNRACELIPNSAKTNCLSTERQD